MVSTKKVLIFHILSSLASQCGRVTMANIVSARAILARAAASRLAPPASVRYISSASATVPLAYDLHEPSGSGAEQKRGPPILFLHGLFGSKKNNRSISKYVLAFPML